MRALALLAVLLLAGCASAPKSVADCGWVLGVPARPIDEGTRYDVKERLQGFGLDDVRYQFRNGTEVAFEGSVGDLRASGGNQTLRYVHPGNSTTLDLGDAHLTVLAALGLLALAASGCITTSTPLQQGAAPLALPTLPSLGFLKEVGVDPEHRGGEPSILADHQGNLYVSAPSGYVATLFNSIVDPTSAQAQGPTNRESFIWKSKDQGATWQLLGMTPPPLPPLRGDAVPGGADTDMVVDNCDTVYFTDLWLGNIGVSHSDDAGATWVGTPVTGILPVLDRNWLAPGKACGEVVLAYQTFYSQLWVLKSTDKGMTFPQQVLVMDCNGAPTATVPGCFNIDGPIIRDAKSGDLFLPVGEADSKGVQVLHSKDDGTTWTVSHIKAEEPTQLFPVMASDAAGNLYVVFSNAHGGSFNVFLSTSTDQGEHWSAPVSVSGPEDKGTEAFPWVIAGDAGKVAITWYGTNDTVQQLDDATSDWFVTMAATDDALSSTPHWVTSKVSEKPNHKGSICTQGLTCTEPQPVGTRGNRNLADFFEATFDMQGHAVVAWADDYDSAATFIAHPMFGRQASGLQFTAPMNMSASG
ncbi:MAG: exo-alpha-sialidase [Halobacteriales archaeon]|nr:exo-alpha-sialidase [Halobacteriales archaeon]